MKINREDGKIILKEDPDLTKAMVNLKRINFMRW